MVCFIHFVCTLYMNSRARLVGCLPVVVLSGLGLKLCGTYYSRGHCQPNLFKEVIVGLFYRGHCMPTNNCYCNHSRLHLF